MKNFTIHIFAYGEAQIISEGIDYKAAFSDFKKLQAVIDDVKTKRPKDVKEAAFHAINIFSDSSVIYISSEKDATFRTTYKQIDAKKINALVKEFSELITAGK